MKKLILTLALIGAMMSVQAQSKSVKVLLDKYSGREDFFHLELGGNFMNFAKGFKIDLDEADMATVAKSIEKLNFFTLPDNSETNRMEYKALQKGLGKEHYELLMESSQGKSGNLMVYSKGSKKITDIVVLLGGDQGELLVVELTGVFDQEVVAKAMKYESRN